MASPTTIEIPRNDEESARAYAARVEYVTMGAGRSLEKLRGQSGGKSGVPNRLSTLEEWSVRFGWQDSARQYDEQVHYLAIQDAATKYRLDLEAHRTRASEAGKALYSVAGKLLQQINQVLASPKKIEGKDGKIYTLHNIDLNASTFAIAARAMQTSLDLEAHALGIDRLLPSLDTDDSE